MDFDQERCQRFIEATTSQPARPMLLRALEHFETPGLAVDLGCGAGNDVLHLLRVGWTVLAIDAHSEAIERTESRARDAGVDARLTVRHQRFSDLELPVGTVDLVHAGFSLPFTAAGEFRHAWGEIGASLRVGGVFAGQLFGPNDDWSRDASRTELTSHTRADVERLLEGRRVHHLDEVERDGVTATGSAKHWHVFHIVAEHMKAV